MPSASPASSKGAAASITKGVLSVIVAGGFNMNTQDENGSSPLHYAVRTSPLPVFKIILESGINVDLIDKNGQTALHLAVIANELKRVDDLLRHGARVDIKDNDGKDALYYSHGEVRLLIQQYVDVSPHDIVITFPEDYPPIADDSRGCIVQ